MAPAIVLQVPAGEGCEAVQSVFLFKQRDALRCHPARYTAVLQPPAHPPLSYTPLLLQYGDRGEANCAFIANLTIACADKGMIKVAKHPTFRLGLKTVIDGEARKEKGFVPVSPNYLSMVSSLYIIIGQESAGFEDFIGRPKGCDTRTLEFYSYVYNHIDDIEDSESDGDEAEEMDSDGGSDMEIRCGRRGCPRR